MTLNRRDFLMISGMGRMGIPFHKAFSYIKEAASLKNIHIQGISTTLTEDTEFDKVQMKRFFDICQKAKNVGIRLGLKHACSSAGILAFNRACLDVVRPGKKKNRCGSSGILRWVSLPSCGQGF